MKWVSDPFWELLMATRVGKSIRTVSALTVLPHADLTQETPSAEDY